MQAPFILTKVESYIIIIACGNKKLKVIPPYKIVVVHTYRTLRAASAIKIIPKIDANFFGILLAFFDEYNINYF